MADPKNPTDETNTQEFPNRNTNPMLERILEELKGVRQRMDTMATKQDLAPMVTKQDLAQMVTKQDLERGTTVLLKQLHAIRTELEGFNERIVALEHPEKP